MRRTVARQENSLELKQEVFKLNIQCRITEDKRECMSSHMNDM
jgi:hypothetical protein